MVRINLDCPLYRWKIKSLLVTKLILFVFFSNNKKLAICYMREPAFEHDLHVEKQILLGHDLVLKHNVNPKNIVYFYSTDLGKQTHKTVAEKHNLKQQPFTIITFPYYEVDAYKKVIGTLIIEFIVVHSKNMLNF